MSFPTQGVISQHSELRSSRLSNDPPTLSLRLLLHVNIIHVLLFQNDAWIRSCGPPSQELVCSCFHPRVFSLIPVSVQQSCSALSVTFHAPYSAPFPQNKAGLCTGPSLPSRFPPSSPHQPSCLSCSLQEHDESCRDGWQDSA